MTNDELHQLIDKQAAAALKTIHAQEYGEIRRAIFSSISTVLNLNKIALDGKESFKGDARSRSEG